MNKIIDTLFRYRFLILLLMVVFSLINAVRFWGEWNNFYSVIVAQVYFGQGIYFFVSGGRISFSPGGGVSSDANPVLRVVVGMAALSLYLMCFFFNGYGRGWF